MILSLISTVFEFFQLSMVKCSTSCTSSPADGNWASYVLVLPAGGTPRIISSRFDDVLYYSRLSTGGYILEQLWRRAKSGSITTTPIKSLRTRMGLNTSPTKPRSPSGTDVHGAPLVTLCCVYHADVPRHFPTGHLQTIIRLSC